MALEKRIRLQAEKQVSALKKDKIFRDATVARKTAMMVNLIKTLEVDAQQRRERLQAFVTRNRMLSQKGVSAQVGQVIRTGVQSFANTSFFGQLPEFVGAVTAPLTAEPGQIGQERRDVTERTRLELEAGQVSSPRAALAGDVAGFLAPTSPASRIMGGAGRLAARPLQRAAAARGGFTGGALQVAGNVAGGTAAIGTLNLFQSNPGADFNDRFDQFIDQASNPLALGLNITLGVVAGSLRVRTQKAEREMLREFRETIPGSRVSPDIPREGTFLGSQLANMFGNFQRFPGFDRIQQKFLRTAVYEPLGKAIDRLERSISPIRGEQVVERGARALTALVGKKQGRGRIERRIRGLEKKAFEQEGDILLGPEMQNRFTREISEFIKSEVKVKGIKELSSPMVALLKRTNAAIDKASKQNKTITLNQLEDLRQELVNVGRIARRNPGVLSDLDRRLSSRALDTINEIYRVRSPKIKAAFEAAEALHRKRSFFPNAEKINRLDPSEILATVGSGKGAIQRWNVMLEFLTPVEIQVARADYLRRFIEKVASKRPGGRIINPQTFNTALQKGEFQEAKMRAILGDVVVNEVKTYARFSERISRGIGQAEGSQTIRGAAAGGVILGLGNILIFGNALMGETFRKVALLGALGTTGVYWLANSLLNASGKAGPLLNRLATGEPMVGLTRGAAFAGSRGLGGITAPILGGVVPPEERTQLGPLGDLEESR